MTGVRIDATRAAPPSRERQAGDEGQIGCRRDCAADGQVRDIEWHGRGVKACGLPDFLTMRKEKELMLKYSPAPSPSNIQSPLAAEDHRLKASAVQGGYMRGTSAVQGGYMRGTSAVQGGYMRGTSAVQGGYM